MPNYSSCTWKPQLGSATDSLELSKNLIPVYTTLALKDWNASYFTLKYFKGDLKEMAWRLLGHT